MKNVQKDTVSFSVKGQVVVPLWLRKEFHIEKGTRTQIESTTEGILIKPVTAKSVRNLRGVLKDSKAWDVFLAERKKERAL